MLKKSSDLGDECVRRGGGGERESKNVVLLCPYLVTDVALAILERKGKILHYKSQNHKPYTDPLLFHAWFGGRIDCVGSRA